MDAHRLSALLREELESLLDELLVELEDHAVAGVWVDHQLVVRQTSVVSMLEDWFERLLAGKNDVVLVKVSG